MPASTYRLQLHGGFTFDQAAQIVPYLADLGVSHLYLSPILQAAPGSLHGYDVIDHTRINEELGGREGFERLAATAREVGLGIVVDVVPNHMAVPVPESLNHPLWEVLRDGRSSAYAHWFDIDFDAEDDTLLMPLLGSELSEVLAANELVCGVGGPSGAEPVLRYADHELPLAPGTAHLPIADCVAAQHYRLVHWRDSAGRLNYRRFFDVTGLIAIRVEDRDVFEATHALLFELLDAGLIDGLRIDHPDGLANPAGYLRWLDERTGGSWVIAEKILEGDEQLPADWPNAGTSGYDALLRVQQLFVDPAGERGLTALWQAQSNDLTGLDELILEAKAQVVRDVLPAEINRLVRDIEHIVPGHEAHEVRIALGELLISMDRYRAYFVPGEPADPISVEVIRKTAQRARELLARDDFPVLRTVVGLVTGSDIPSGLDVTDPYVADAIVRFQQTCGPVMAKGVEDTAFYRYARLAGLNEVGGDPGRIGIDPEDVHDFNARLLAERPTTMTAASTHDTKRSEDVRARLSVLSELPDEWAAWVARARELATGYRRRGVDGATEYLIWQTLVGAWPIDGERLTGYVEKAVRESKARTTWVDVDETYEEAIGRLVDGILGDAAISRHVEDWLEVTAAAARVNVLGQKAVQLTMPGVPDVYQGTELVDLSLVDPDNRRPVDYALRVERLAALDAAGAGGEQDLNDDKLLVTSRVLRLRRDHPEWFTGEDSGYAVLSSRSPHLFAFGRGAHSEVEVVTVVTRLSTGLARAGGWSEEIVEIPAGTWRNVLPDKVFDVHEGEGIRAAELLRELPVAVLVRQP